MKYGFYRGKDLLDLCQREGITISEVMLRREEERSLRTRDDILSEMAGNLAVMRSSIEEGLNPKGGHHGMIAGGDAIKLENYAGRSILGKNLAQIAAASMAVVEVNASMGRIVAAPTAGASGIVPAVLITGGMQEGLDDGEIVMGLFTAGAVGMVIAGNASVSGAAGGCQAETGSAAAMAAAALTGMRGGSPGQCLTAAAIALKNIMGLVCDPVGGLVECPCVKRNAMGAVNAVLSSDMALSGITSFIPFDDAVSAMKSVGQQMHPDLRETGRGGLAGTETAREFRKKYLRP